METISKVARRGHCGSVAYTLSESLDTCQCADETK